MNDMVKAFRTKFLLESDSFFASQFAA